MSLGNDYQRRAFLVDCDVVRRSRSSFVPNMVAVELACTRSIRATSHWPDASVRIVVARKLPFWRKARDYIR